MKIDTHIHSSGISKCSQVTFEEIVKYKKEQGIDGGILTNHCQPWYYETEDYKPWIKSFIEEYKRAKNYGDDNNFKYFLGIEVSINIPKYADFLLFGVTEEILLDSPDLCRLSQEELYRFSVENNILLVQAHPLREKFTLMDTSLMDGIEINLRSSDIDKKDEIIRLANKHNLLITCGTDYHNYDQKVGGGLVLPDNISTSVDIAKEIRKNNGTKVFIENEIYNFNRK